MNRAVEVLIASLTAAAAAWATLKLRGRPLVSRLADYAVLYLVFSLLCGFGIAALHEIPVVFTTICHAVDKNISKDDDGDVMYWMVTAECGRRVLNKSEYEWVTPGHTYRFVEEVRRLSDNQLLSFRDITHSEVGELAPGMRERLPAA